MSYVGKLFGFLYAISSWGVHIWNGPLQVYNISHICFPSQFHIYSQVFVLFLPISIPSKNKGNNRTFYSIFS